MTNYLATDTDLTSVADAIRTKGGTSADLEFPYGFVSAIEAIPTGGGGVLETPEEALNAFCASVGGFALLEFTNTSSAGTNIVLSHSLGYAPQTIIMVPKGQFTAASNTYNCGICTKPSDQVSSKNNTCKVAAQASTALADLTSSYSTLFFEPFSFTQNGQFTFIPGGGSTSSTVTIRNGTGGTNNTLQQNTTFIVAIK